MVVPKSALEDSWTNDTMEAATSHQAARSANCKMVDAARVPEDLGVTMVTTATCGDVDKQTLAKASWFVRDESRMCCELEGRGWCCKPDATVVGNIGPLVCPGTITLTETCWEVTSLSLVATTSSLFFPGIHYCKLLSPARAMVRLDTMSHSKTRRTSF